MAIPTPQSGSARPAHGGPSITPLVLVVDDEERIRELLCEALVLYGLEVVAVPNVRDALEQLATLQYDVAIIDICLPDGSGTEVIQRALRCSPPVPCIAMTGVAQTETMTKCVEMGATACLWKPFRLETLADAVQRTLPPGKRPAAPAALRAQP